MISILPESNYAAVMTETVEPYLDSRRQEMDMPHALELRFFAQTKMRKIS